MRHRPHRPVEDGERMDQAGREGFSESFWFDRLA
jgi:hypothetical protein